MLLVACEHRLFNWLDDERYLKLVWRARTGKKLDLEKPVTYNEKLQWLKLNYRTSLQTKCVDKYRVREYVSECGLENILVDLLAVYDRPEDVDFDKLPTPCFIKCNNSSGGNMIYSKEKGIDKKQFVKSFKKLLRRNTFCYGREWPYKDVVPKIVVEKVLRDNDGNLPVDYKFFCFNGKTEFVFVNKDVCSEEGKHRTDDTWNVFDLNLKPLDFKIGRCDSNYHVDIPKNWDEMIRVSEILARPFPHCRIDLYNVDGRIFFGEITFFHQSGFVEIEPIEWNIKYGDLLDISKL